MCSAPVICILVCFVIFHFRNIHGLCAKGEVKSEITEKEMIDAKNQGVNYEEGVDCLIDETGWQ